MRRHRKICVLRAVLEASCPAQTAAGEAVFILRPLNYALPGMPEREKRNPAHWVAEHEVKPPPQKTRKKHEPGHMPIAAPAMLEGYASTRPPRTEQ